MAEGDSLSADDELALALARGVGVAEAAKLAGVSERTAFRRLSDSKFREQVNSIRRRVFDGAVGRLVEVSGRAVEGLVDLMEGDYPAAQKLAACRAVLEFSAKLRQEAEFEDRLASLEERINGSTTSASEAA